MADVQPDSGGITAADKLLSPHLKGALLMTKQWKPLPFALLTLAIHGLFWACALYRASNGTLPHGD